MDESKTAEPEILLLEIPQTKMSKTYYEIAGKIDQHNRKRQDDLEFERWLCFKSREKRLASTMLAIVCTDAMNLHQILSGAVHDSSPNEWFCKLADELIENKLDEIHNGAWTRSIERGDSFAAQSETASASASRVPTPVPSLLRKLDKNKNEKAQTPLYVTVPSAAKRQPPRAMFAVRTPSSMEASLISK